MLRPLRRTFAALTLAGLLAGSALAGGEGWTEDFTGAKQTATTQSKDMLLDFTGSDWCGWCVKLNKEVFSHDEFKTYAKDNFVLVELDYPRAKEQSDEIKTQNAALKTTYAIRGYPTILLTDELGRPYAKTGYKAGGPEAYVDHLEELKQVRVNRDEQLDAAENAEGLAKAKHLHEAMQTVGDDLALTHYKETVNQIIELDAENKAGLKKYYDDLATTKQLKAEIQQTMRSAQADAPAAIAKLDAMLAQDNLTTAIRQEALAMKSQIQLFIIKDQASAKATLLKAIEADPESDMAKQLKTVIDNERFFPAQAE